MSHPSRPRASRRRARARAVLGHARAPGHRAPHAPRASRSACPHRAARGTRATGTVSRHHAPRTARRRRRAWRSRRGAAPPPPPRGARTARPRPPRCRSRARHTAACACAPPVLAAGAARASADARARRSRCTRGARVLGAHALLCGDGGVGAALLLAPPPPPVRLAAPVLADGLVAARARSTHSGLTLTPACAPHFEPTRRGRSQSGASHRLPPPCVRHLPDRASAAACRTGSTAAGPPPRARCTAPLPRAGSHSGSRRTAFPRRGSCTPAAHADLSHGASRQRRCGSHPRRTPAPGGEGGTATRAMSGGGGGGRCTSHVGVIDVSIPRGGPLVVGRSLFEQPPGPAIWRRTRSVDAKPFVQFVFRHRHRPASEQFAARDCTVVGWTPFARARAPRSSTMAATSLRVSGRTEVSMGGTPRRRTRSREEPRVSTRRGCLVSPRGTRRKDPGIAEVFGRRSAVRPGATYPRVQPPRPGQTVGADRRRWRVSSVRQEARRVRLTASTSRNP